jgi:hypothetical protein
VKFTWFYDDQGPGQIAEIVSYSKPVAKKMKAEAKRMAIDANATLNAAAEHRTGASQIGLTQLDLDFYVYLTAPGSKRDPDGEAAALSIEKGHYVRDREHEGEGPRTKTDHDNNWVEGLMPLTTAMNNAIRRGRGIR